MKKLFILSAMLIAGLTSSFAQELTAKAYISMDGTTLKLRERADYVVAEPQATASDYNNVGAAALYNGARYIQFGTNDLEGLALSVVVPANATAITLSFSSVAGTPLYILDAQDGSRTLIEANGSKEYEVIPSNAASTINDRFSISKIGEVEPQICHEGQLLKVTNYNGIVKVDDDEYQVAGNLDIDIANLSAGHHTVNFDGQDLIINVK